MEINAGCLPEKFLYQPWNILKKKKKKEIMCCTSAGIPSVQPEDETRQSASK